MCKINEQTLLRHPFWGHKTPFTSAVFIKRHLSPDRTKNVNCTSPSGTSVQIPNEMFLLSTLCCKCYILCKCTKGTEESKARYLIDFLDKLRTCSIKKYLTFEYHCYLLSRSFWLYENVSVRSTIPVPSSFNEGWLITPEPRQKWRTLAPKQKKLSKLGRSLYVCGHLRTICLP